jgi:hypothetical protein
VDFRILAGVSREPREEPVEGRPHALVEPAALRGSEQPPGPARCVDFDAAYGQLGTSQQLLDRGDAARRERDRRPVALLGFLVGRNAGEAPGAALDVV